ncbi:MAG TPA: hypothetical protein VFP98_04595, partial [Candidatus Polarisedimenticolia bacterium]|nr:hypothetical protein [Candidatus Polarisedimenticolia bacterium]
MPFGSVEDWSRFTLITVLGLTLALFLWAGPPIRLSRRESAALGLGVVFLAWLALQLVPVPQSLIESIAPATARLNRIAVPGAGSSDPRGYAFPVPSAPADGGASLPVRWILPDRAGPRPLSLHPYATYRVLCQSAALVGCLLMMLVLFRERRAERVAMA